MRILFMGGTGLIGSACSAAAVAALNRGTCSPRTPATRPRCVPASRMRRGAKIIVPGDGTSIWTLTHNTDFAAGLMGLLGQPTALGEDFHITSDEALSWNQIYSLTGAAAGVRPDIMHVPAAGITAANPAEEGNLWGDKLSIECADWVHASEMADLEALARTCSQLRRWEFFAVIATISLAGSTSSPVNPLAMF